MAILPLVGEALQADDGVMFDPYCNRHGSRVLLSNRRIRSIVNDGDGVAVHFVCTCGASGVWRTGRRRAVVEE
jgi:hypothetical protein